jgi:hypothetical protein
MEVKKEELNPDFTSFIENEYKNQINDHSSLRFIKQSQNSIISRFGDLSQIDSCSKKLPIISDSNIFLENLAAPVDKVMDYYVVNSRVIDSDSIYFGSAVSQSREEIWFRSSNIILLESWFKKSKLMLDSKKIVYVPSFDRIEATSEFYFNQGGENPGEFFDFTDRNPKIIRINPIQYNTPFKAMLESDIEVNDPFVIPLFNFEIPGLENITPSQLSNLMDDNLDMFKRFRNMIQKKLLDFKSKLGTEDFNKETRKIELEIDDGVMKLKDDLKILKKTKAVEVIGAQAITWTLYVFVFLNSATDLLKILLPGGALAALSVSYAKYLKL